MSWQPVAFLPACPRSPGDSSDGGLNVNQRLVAVTWKTLREKTSMPTGRPGTRSQSSSSSDCLELSISISEGLQPQSKRNR